MKLREAARQEWEANFNLGRIERPAGWDTAIWLDYLAARTEFIVRQVPLLAALITTDGEAEWNEKIQRALDDERPSIPLADYLEEVADYENETTPIDEEAS